MKRPAGPLAGLRVLDNGKIREMDDENDDAGLKKKALAVAFSVVPFSLTDVFPPWSRGVQRAEDVAARENEKFSHAKIRPEPPRPIGWINSTTEHPEHPGTSP